MPSDNGPRARRAAARSARVARFTRLSHVDARGRVQMVDVGGKAATVRDAVAACDVRMSAAARRAIRTRAVKKGDPLQTARIAGIMAAKRTAEWIPLCHTLSLTSVEVSLEAGPRGYRITARVATVARTGVEMEALVAVSAAALTLYDMLKAVDRAIVIDRVRLLEKRGGRSGTYRRRGRR
jgi:cyclic pyranopterin phosphate synthase